MTKTERAQLNKLYAELESHYDRAQMFKLVNEETGDEASAQHWDGVMGGLAMALNRLREIRD